MTCPGSPLPSSLGVCDTRPHPQYLQGLCPNPKLCRRSPVRPSVMTAHPHGAGENVLKGAWWRWALASTMAPAPGGVKM